MKAEENVVIIRRRVDKNLNKNQTLKTLNNLSVKYLGAAKYLGSDLPVTGLSPVEKFAIMPSLVQLANNHNEFDLVVNNYFHDLRAEVPTGKGLKLDIRTEKVEINYAGEKHIVDMPKNPYHYIIYKRAICPDYIQCAKTPEEAKGAGDRVKFYIHNLKDAQDAEIKLGNARDKAYMAFVGLKDKTDLWDDVLTVYGVNPKMLSHNDKLLKLRGIAEAVDFKDASEKLEEYEKFAKLATDEDLDTKALLTKLISAKLILISGKSYIYDNEAGTVVIGTSEREAILWLQDANNSKDVLTMEAKLEGKK